MKILALIGETTDCVRLSAKLGECTAVAVTAEPGALFAQARSDGATQLIQIWDEGLAELEREPLSRELMLTALLSALGRQLETRFFVVPETRYGWLGPALAEELDLPHVSAVLSAEAVKGTPAQNEAYKGLPILAVRRRCLQGVQRLRGPAVGVLCLLPRDAAKSSPTAPESGELSIDKWDLARLGLGPVDLPRPLLRLVVPEKRQELGGRTFDSLATLAERLRQDGLSPNQPAAPAKEGG